MKIRFSLKQFLIAAALFSGFILFPLLLHHKVLSVSEKQAVTYSKSEFISNIAPIIQEAAEAYDVRPSIIIAQAIFESDYGTNLVATKYNNLFAVQSLAGDDQVSLRYQVYNSGTWKEKTGSFTRYSNWEDAIYDYFDRLKLNKVGNEGSYTTLLSYNSYKEAISHLGGFSSDPNYASELIAIIEDNNLTDYDK